MPTIERGSQEGISPERVGRKRAAAANPQYAAKCAERKAPACEQRSGQQGDPPESIHTAPSGASPVKNRAEPTAPAGRDDKETTISRNPWRRGRKNPVNARTVSSQSRLLEACIPQ
jgi:hypothetical protein